MNTPLSLSTFELELILNTNCDAHKSTLECDVCRAKSFRIAKLFQKHEPKGIVIKTPKLFRILFPHHDDEVLLTHVLYAYICAVEYVTFLMSQDAMREVSDAISYRRESEKKWLDEADSDKMFCFALEAILCHRIAALNIHATDKDLRRKRLDEEALGLLASAGTREFERLETKETDQSKAYRKFYLTISKA